MPAADGGYRPGGDGQFSSLPLPLPRRYFVEEAVGVAVGLVLAPGLDVPDGVAVPEGVPEGDAPPVPVVVGDGVPEPVGVAWTIAGGE
jgi:hypothetical protein